MKANDEQQRLNSMLCYTADLLALVQKENALCITVYKPAETIIQNACIDSRSVSANALFVALPGRNTDGHHYLQEAAAGGAVALLIRKEYAHTHQKYLQNIAARHNSTILAVDDPLRTLQKLAAWNRKRCSNTRVVAITGSNGKTTTKTLLGRILSASALTYVSKGNFNSEIGVALSLCELRREHIYAVFEAGIDKIGEMDCIEDMLRPDIAILTNIGHAHIGNLGSRTAIFQEKRKLFIHASCCILPAFDPFFALLSADLSGEILSYGTEAELAAAEPDGMNGTRILLAKEEYYLPLVGRHNVCNALAALALARKLRLPPDNIRKGIETMVALPGRGEIFRGSITIIGDWYNASPESIEASLHVLRILAEEVQAKRRIVILGGMKELGEYSKSLHLLVYQNVCAEKPDAVFLCGQEFSVIEALQNEHYHYQSIYDLLPIVQSYVQEGDCILIKGSRTYTMEVLYEPLKRNKERKQIYAS